MINDDFIIGFILKHKSLYGGNSPSIRQISTACKISKNAAYKKIIRLERQGKLQRCDGKITFIL